MAFLSSYQKRVLPDKLAAGLHHVAHELGD
jgi:hypothetical protein